MQVGKRSQYRRLMLIPAVHINIDHHFLKKFSAADCVACGRRSPRRQRAISSSSRAMRFSSSCAERAEISSPSTISGSFLRGCNRPGPWLSLLRCSRQPFRGLVCAATKARASHESHRRRKSRATITGWCCAKIPQPAPGPGQVLIAVAAAGLNNADLLQARGPLSAAARRFADPGHGSVGHHRGAGRRRQRLEGGRKGLRPVARRRLCRICAWPTPAALLPVPDSVDLVEAAGLPEAAFTAWTNIMDTRPAAARRRRC